jgi:hypothetical protein
LVFLLLGGPIRPPHRGGRRGRPTREKTNKKPNPGRRPDRRRSIISPALSLPCVTQQCFRAGNLASGPDFGQILIGKASKSALRRAGPSARREALPTRIRPKSCLEARFPARKHYCVTKGKTSNGKCRCLAEAVPRNWPNQTKSIRNSAIDPTRALIKLNRALLGPY